LRETAYRTGITRKEKVRNNVPHFLLLPTILLDINENSEDSMKL